MTLRPVARRLIPSWSERDGQPFLILRDPDEVMAKAIAVPPIAGLILDLSDGTRSVAEIAAEGTRIIGRELPKSIVADLVAHLDEAMALEGPRSASALDNLRREYRSRPRPAALAGTSYPAARADLADHLSGFGRGDRELPSTSDIHVRGVISPHIDYQRGGPTYHRVFSRATPAIRRAKRVIVIGTDHAGGPAHVTPTAQDFETPFGTFAADRQAVARLIHAVGADHAAVDELHHRGEHSIELALNWIAHAAGDPLPRLVPVLTGSFFPFIRGERAIEQDPRISTAVRVLSDLALDGDTIVVAAADLAHMGPEFSDPEPLTDALKNQAREADERLLRAIAWGNADRFLAEIVAEQDRRHVCGVSPIYLALRALSPQHGEVVRYDQCPADTAGQSIVTIAGALLW